MYNTYVIEAESKRVCKNLKEQQPKDEANLSERLHCGYLHGT